jgi:hypothetical protein
MPTPKLEDLESAVLQLPQAERVLLAERLLASLDGEDEVMREWIALAETRADALGRGEANTMGLESMLQEIRTSPNE